MAPYPGNSTTVSARDEILARIRTAVANVDRSSTAVPRDYRRAHHGDHLVALFCERAADYRAEVRRLGSAAVGDAVAQVLTDRAVTSVAVPPDLPDAWLADVDAEVRRDDPPLTVADLDACDATVTGAALAIAETGTIVLDSGARQGRRALTLVPDMHVCVVQANQIVADVPDAVAALDPLRPQTWISGPSATSDIELDRVEGVHGPRTLVVLVVDPDPAMLVEVIGSVTSR